MKKWEYALLSGLIIAVLVSFVGARVYSFDRGCDGIRDSVLRLHILANSDSDADQSLKLKVRDRLLHEGRELFSDCQSRDKAEQKAKSEVERLTAAAEEVIATEGYSYPVKIYIGDADFNIRQYGDVTLPSGRYRAVNVVIGSGEGHNWWCVMFPPLCLPAAEEVNADKDEIEEVLTDEQTDIVENSSKYEFKLKIVELWNRWTKKLQDK